MGRLYLVGTPIGNLSDVSKRCIEVLQAVDFIAAEDTRVTLKLLNSLDIKKPLVNYFEHNRRTSGPKIIQRILDGEDCALVTDAGMPAISDPGEELVAQAAQAGIEVLCIPGPCALVSALALSGLPTGRFTFEGFLSVNKKSRFYHLEMLRGEERTMIFYEAPHKLKATLNDMYAVFGDRRVSISRELTKLYEQTMRCTLSEAIEHFETVPPKGEFVLVIEGCAKQEKLSAEQALEKVKQLRAEGKSLRDAVKICAEQTDVSKNELYELAIKEQL